MSGFYAKGENFDRLFISQHQFAERFLGNQLYTWGIDGAGQLGTGLAVSTRSSPGEIAATAKSNNWVKATTGSTYSTLALKSDGSLWGFGFNDYGQIGDGSNINKSSPSSVVGGITWIDSASGNQFSSGIKNDGTLWTWGRNQFGQLGDGTTVNKNSPITALGNDIGWQSISLGDNSAGGIKLDGSLWTWGRNNYGQLGDGTTVNKSSPVSVAGGGNNWKFISFGSTPHAAAIKIDGTLWTWGRNSQGALGTGTVINRSSPGTVVGGGTWKSVRSLNQTTAAIKTDGTLWTWGNNTTYGLLGNNSTISRSSPGTVSGGGTNWKKLSIAGNSSTIASCGAIKTDGTLWVWGSNTSGKLGLGDTINRSSPTQLVSGISNWINIALGTDFSVGIASIE